jgi:PKD repeat protein
MLRVFLFGITVILFCFPAADGADIFDGPESVAFDSLSNCYFISNCIEGSVIRIDNYGDTGYFQTGLGHAYGNCIKDNIFYVSTDEHFKGFDMATGEEIYDLHIPIATRNLDGVTYDTSGYFYVLCTGGTLYRINLDELTYEVLVSGGFPNSPQDIIFDKFNNRILVASYAGGSDIMQVSLPDGTLSSAGATVTGLFDGISIDAEGYIYLASHYTPGIVYRYNNDFTVGPELISNNYDQPAGLDYNVRDDILVVPVFVSDEVDFIHLYLDFEADTLWGYAPLEVSFTGSPGALTIGQALTWSWDFGDGGSGTSSAPVHTYTEPGAYNVTAAVELPDETNHDYTRYSYIFILADTVKGEDVEFGTDTVEVTIDITNTMPLKSLDLPIEYSGDVNLNLLGCSTDGCRNGGFSQTSWLDNNSTEKRATLHLEAGNGHYLQTGDGPAVKLRFELITAEYDDTTRLIFDGYDSYSPLFHGAVGEYTPEVLPLSVTFIKTGCCEGVTGDADCSGGEPDISDITRLIDYLYISHNPLCCAEEADVDASGGEPDISDITYLIDNLYISHKALPMCP